LGVDLRNQELDRHYPDGPLGQLIAPHLAAFALERGFNRGYSLCRGWITAQEGFESLLQAFVVDAGLDFHDLV
jgi:hypothetical protein